MKSTLNVLCLLLLLAACGGRNTDALMSGPGVSMPIPADVLHTRSTATFQVVPQGPIKRVELLMNGVPLAVFDSSNRFVWNSEEAAEGEYRFQARGYFESSSVDSEVRTVIVDRTPPAVTSMTPPVGGESIGGVATVTFSETILKGSSLDSSVAVTSAGNAIQKTVVLEANDKSLSIIPEPTLALPNRLDVVFGSSITDLAGNPVEVDQQYSYQATGLELKIVEMPPLTRAAVALKVESSGKFDGNVTITKNGQPWKNLSVPYADTWDVASEPDGQYSFVARASVGAFVFESAPVLVILDRAAPQLTARVPAPGAGILMRDGIQLQFSEPVSRQGLSSQTVKVKESGGASVPVKEVTFADQDRKVVINLAAVTSFPKELWVELPPQLSDLAGNQLENAPPIGPMPLRAWEDVGGPLLADWRIGQATEIELAIDETGAPVAAWGEHDPLNKNLYVRRWDGSNWQPMERAESFSNIASRWAIASNARGDLKLAYLKGNPGNQQLLPLVFQKWNPILARWEEEPSSIVYDFSGQLTLSPNGGGIHSYLFIPRGVPDFVEGASTWWVGSRMIGERGDWALAGDKDESPLIVSPPYEGIGARVSRIPWRGAWEMSALMDDAVAEYTALAVNPVNNRPIVAYITYQGLTPKPPPLRVQTLSGDELKDGTWVDIGRPDELLPSVGTKPWDPYAPRNSARPLISVNKVGLPSIAWITGDYRIAFARWDGTKWSGDSNLIAPQPLMKSIAMVLDHDGRAIIGWVGTPSPDDISGIEPAAHVIYSNQ